MDEPRQLQDASLFHLQQASSAGITRRRFRSFKTKLTLLVALAVLVPTAFACLIFGTQLDRQTRALFAGNLTAQLETFSLILRNSEDSLVRGLARTAADNTLQITLDLGIAAQLTRYMDRQRPVLEVDFLGAYKADLQPMAVSHGQDDRTSSGMWRLGEPGEDGGGECRAAREPLQIATCNDTVYLVSVQPIERGRATNRGDAAGAGQSTELLGYLVGGVRLAGPALISSLQERQITHPVIWVGDRIVYSNLPVQALAAPAGTDGSASEYLIDKTAYLGAAKAATIGARRLTYAVLAPLEPLRAALSRSVLVVGTIGLLLAVGTLIALSFIARRISHPIRLLREGAARIGAGVLDHRIAVSTGDELEALADQFNHMASRLRASYAELEAKVEERTHELQQREAVLRVTFDNMAHGVVMFDDGLRMAAWNRQFEDLLDLTDGFCAGTKTYPDFVRYLAQRGEFGAVDPEAELHRYTENAGKHYSFERTRPNGAVLEIRHNPVPGGGFVLIYTDITERKQAEAQIRAAKEAAEAAFRELKAAQANLVHAEKMASLGQLTAGIAHEIKNPLNFVNNFAGLSNELLDELKEALGPAMEMLDGARRADVDDLIATLSRNLSKIAEHGRRADGIVKSMLLHSRGGSGERQKADLNALIEEALNLAYHGARAQDQSFNVTIERDLDPNIGTLEVVPQDLTRVFLNLFGNAFYATGKRKRDGTDADYQPVLRVSTRDLGDQVEVRVRDNGIGMAPDVRAKLFTPFFTTKPTGEGTGLGLSISYDIVVQAHGGTITVDSRAGEFTEFVIRLPRAARLGTTSKPAANRVRS